MSLKAEEYLPVILLAQGYYSDYPIYANVSISTKTISTSGAITVGSLSFVNASSGNVSVILPDATIATPYIPTYIKKIDTSANEVQILPVNSQTIDGAPYQVLSIGNTDMCIISDTANWWIL